tara:strand:- start:1466 stop:2320 length:855 start_codon:yes stop_codon:yes gene_type:complete
LSRRNNPERLGAPQPDAPAPPPQTTNTQTDIFSFINPTEFVDLPSKGELYPEGHPAHGLDSIEIRHMTAKEEDILTSESLIKKGVALDRVIDSLIVNKNIKAANLLIGDKNALLIAARITGFGSDYGVKITCPACGEQTDTNINLSDIQIKDLVPSEDYKLLPNGNYEIVFPTYNDLVVEVRLLRGADERKLTQAREQRKKSKKDDALITDQLSAIIVRVMDVTDPALLKQFVEQCPTKISREIRTKYETIMPDVDMKVPFDCSNCDYESEVTMPLTADFFWPG